MHDPHFRPCLDAWAVVWTMLSDTYQGEHTMLAVKPDYYVVTVTSNGAEGEYHPTEKPHAWAPRNLSDAKKMARQLVSLALDHHNGRGEHIGTVYAVIDTLGYDQHGREVNTITRTPVWTF